jgi:Chromate resistance exported protein
MSAVLANREIKPRRQDWLAGGPGFEPGLTESESAVLPLKARTGQVLEIDFFGANGRETVDGLLAGLEDTFKEVSVTAAAQSGPGPDGASDVTRRIWVTRQGVNVDRIASAWLIRLFIDPAAQFKFVVGKSCVLATSGNFTQGNVTALAGIGDDSRYLQISTPVQAGNSGGPLLDQNGNLGIVTSKLNALKMAQASGDLPQNVNFALKAEIIVSFLDINRIKYTTGSATSAFKPEELVDQAKAISMFILCK